MIRFHILTLFPEMFDSYFSLSIVGRAQTEKKIKIDIYNIRDYSKDPHKKTDDRAYGGGPGMVMTVQPIVDAVLSLQKKIKRRKNTSTKIIIFTPEQTPFTTAYAKDLAEAYTDIVLICGRYEGIDTRVRDILGAEEVSIGDYVLTGGELPAMIVVDSTSRQIEGVLGKFDSREEARVSSHEIYTRPANLIYEGVSYTVPEVLQNGNHKEIEAWKKESVKKK